MSSTRRGRATGCGSRSIPAATDATFNLFRRRSSRVGEDEPLVRADGHVAAPDWSPDDRHLLYTKLSATTQQRGLWTLSLTGDRQQSVFLDTKHNETSGVFSPDGHWIAYVSDESGRQSGLRAAVSPPGRTVVDLTRWGTGPAMARGQQGALFPRTRRRDDGRGYQGRQRPARGNRSAAALWDGTRFHGPTNSHTRSTAAGQRFLIPVAADPPGAAPISVVMAWPGRLPRHRPEP